MKIGVIGAGAMGSLYGGYLANSDNEVYLVDIWEQHVNEINENGLIIIEDDIENIAKPAAVTDSSELGEMDLVIVFVKSIHTKAAIRDNLSLIGKNTLVLSLQNGYGNAEDISSFVEEDNIIVGTTAHGGTMISPGRIKHAGKGITYLGKLSGSNDKKIEEIKVVLTNAGFETKILDKVMEIIWGKLFVNIGINALTGILEIENGQLPKQEEGRELITLVVSEAVEVVNKLGFDFDKDKTIANVINVAEATAKNKSSMLQDVLKNRETEIDRINGAIVREGKKLGIATPINTTLTNLIKLKR